VNTQSSPLYKKLKIYIFTYFYILLSAIAKMTPEEVNEAMNDLQERFNLATSDPYTTPFLIARHKKQLNASIVAIYKALELANNN
jgi:hypothetical protein